MAQVQPAFIYPSVSTARLGLKAKLTRRFYKGGRPKDIDTALHRCQRCATYSLTLTAPAVNSEQAMKGKSVH